jgi:hypothetical protein
MTNSSKVLLGIWAVVVVYAVLNAGMVEVLLVAASFGVPLWGMSVLLNRIAPQR